MFDELGEYSVYLIIVVYLIYILAIARFEVFIVFVIIAGIGRLGCVPRFCAMSIVLAIAFVISFLILWFLKRSNRESFTDENDTTTQDNDDTKGPKKVNVQQDDDDDDDDEAGEIDMNKTFLEAYQNLNSDQIGSMTAETQKLIDTQKQLMQTLKNLTPIVKQGKELMDGFKGHFGGDKDFAKTMKAYLPLIAGKPKK
tara:strand:- start:9334 stop:9927 length:594 start_codon:yes stop_codon:yes gene_type:complete